MNNSDNDITSKQKEFEDFLKKQQIKNQTLKKLVLKKIEAILKKLFIPIH